ncbi:molecular chaperone HtpG [Sandaracinus amylolyticus]|uniref:Chaperone protein HtpG n=1 Tax=Sandaracinus amylolyticus TaxID=927083 RepID=A0A0F6W6I3_9BACT|nr:molecular chaperone HtpG [Sandaracinus amylolyticus]AKF08756.1 Chaperone protein HtpG [Sandaracinus amylolyticus]
MTDATQTAETAPARTTHRFEAEVDQVLRLVIRSLYSNKEIFLRELLSNASDALDKLRFRALTEPALRTSEELRIRLEPDAASKTLTIWDDGIGMTRDELAQNLGTIAKSGTRELLEKVRAAGQKDAPALIGQFGVGFYSAFLVAERVDVISRAAGHEDAWKWSSDAQGTFTIEPAAPSERRDVPGSSVVLHLSDEHVDLLRTWKLEELVRKYSDYLEWPIELKLEREKDESAPAEWRRVNRGTPLWQRSASEVTPEQYEEHYRHLTHDFEKPLLWRHFRVEGTTEFAGILYVPRRPPFDLFAPESKHGLRLHVKRVFVMEDEGEVLPKWLRFVRGVVDSEDLPLNVSRELLQDSRIVRTIKKQIVKQVLDGLTQLANERPEDYALFWKTFGAVLKEGLHYEPDQAERLAKLLRYESSAVEKGALVSLADAKARMKEGQKAIYYALGESRRQIESSPHIEGLTKHGFEVLYMIDPVDQWAVQSLREIDGTPLQSATAAELDLGSKDDATEQAREESKGAVEALRSRARTKLQDQVSEVRVSARLTDSPVCLVVPEGGLPPHLERLLRATQQDLPPQKRILEINPDHPLVRALAKLIEAQPDRAEIDEWIELLHEQALIAEGSPIDDPGRFTKRLTSLLTEAATRAVGG